MPGAACDLSVDVSAIEANGGADACLTRGVVRSINACRRAESPVRRAGPQTT